MNKLTEGSNMRWESSRMMLPEHIQALRQHEIDKQKIERPVLSDDELADIQNTLQKVIKTHEFVEINYYRDGFIRKQICTVARLDPDDRTIHFFDGFGLSGKILFADVVAVSITVQDGE
jgi:YolD-like protein.